MSPPPFERILQQLATHLSRPIQYQSQQRLYGGDINQSFLLKTASNERLFIKLNKTSRLSMFEAEAAALQEMAHSNTIRVPTPLLANSEGSYAFLVMEYIEMGGSTQKSEETLGQQLAAMHQVTRPHFGWNRDNTIGSTPQLNTESSDWTKFWRDQRLAPQLRWASSKGASSTLLNQGEELLNALDTLLADHTPTPSLLHGDLWGGNWSTTQSGEPILPNRWGHSLR